MVKQSAMIGKHSNAATNNKTRQHFPALRNFKIVNTDPTNASSSLQIAVGVSLN